MKVCRWKGESSPLNWQHKSGVCAPVFELKDYLCFVCTIYNLLSSSVSLILPWMGYWHQEWQRDWHCGPRAAHTSSQHLQVQSQKLWQLMLVAINSKKCSSHLQTPQLMQPSESSPATLVLSIQSAILSDVCLKSDFLPLHQMVGSQISK